MSGLDIEPEDLDFIWHVNLPEDELEKAQIFQTKVNAGFSVVEEMKRTYGLSDSSASEEYKQHLEEVKKFKDIEQKQSDFKTNVATNEKMIYNVDEIRRSNDQISDKKVDNNIEKSQKN